MAITDLVIQYPRTSLILISVVMSLFVTIVRYYMTDRERMKEIKEKQKGLRAEMKNHKGNPEKMMEIQQRMLEDMPEQMKQSFKPMLITMIPFLILFAWLKSTYALTAIADTWFWWYLGAALISGITVSKAFGLQ